MLLECSQCHEKKPDKAFNQDKQKKTGFSSACKICINASQGKPPPTRTNMTTRNSGQLTTMLRTALEEGGGLRMRKVIEKLISCAEEGDLVATRMVFERLEGVVKQQVILEGSETNPVSFVIADSNQLIAKLRGVAQELIANTQAVDAEFTEVK
jgi:ribosomal protein L17